MFKYSLLLCTFLTTLSAENTSVQSSAGDLIENHNNNALELFETKTTASSEISHLLEQSYKLCDELKSETDLYFNSYKILNSKLDSSPLTKAQTDNIRQNAHDAVARVKLSLVEIKSSSELLQSTIQNKFAALNLIETDRANLQHAKEVIAELASSIAEAETYVAAHDQDIQSKISSTQGENISSAQGEIADLKAEIVAGHKKHEEIIAEKDKQIINLENQLKAVTDPDL